MAGVSQDKIIQECKETVETMVSLAFTRDEKYLQAISKMESLQNQCSHTHLNGKNAIKSHPYHSVCEICNLIFQPWEMYKAENLDSTTYRKIDVQSTSHWVAHSCAGCTDVTEKRGDRKTAVKAEYFCTKHKIWVNPFDGMCDFFEKREPHWEPPVLYEEYLKWKK